MQPTRDERLQNILTDFEYEQLTFSEAREQIETLLDEAYARGINVGEDMGYVWGERAGYNSGYEDGREDERLTS
jgi:flagellar biosynthesis/type III secretory pathway protein FliH